MADQSVRNDLVYSNEINGFEVKNVLNKMFCIL